MANEMLTAGVFVAYAVETAYDTKPTTGYKKLPGITDISAIDIDPEMVDVTDLSDTKYRRYIPGLTDLGNQWELTANKTNQFVTAWKNLMTAYEQAVADNKGMWFAVVFPGNEAETFYVRGIPNILGLPDISVGDKQTCTARVTPNRVHGFDAKPTGSIAEPDVA